jgi:hypothetical protein
MPDTSIDPAAVKHALEEIARALESLELSTRSGGRFRASDLKIMLDAVKELASKIEVND